MKTILSLLALIVTVGCSSINPALVRQGVATGVKYGVQTYPQSVPEVRIAAEVICAAADGTNISPASIVEEIQATQPNISPETTLIINSALLLYIGVWNSHGAGAVNSVPQLQPYLQATCSGIHDGLPSGLHLKSVATVKDKWPLVRAKQEP